MKAIKTKYLFDGYTLSQDKVVIWESNKIIAIGDFDILKQYTISDIIETNNILAPGFVDIQVNGAGGVNFYKEGISLDTINTMSRVLIGLGCTSFCPTLISSSDEDIQNALDLVNSLDREALGVLGLHIEGPMFAQDFRGAHSLDIIRLISEELLDNICRSKVSVVTLAPETVPDYYISKLLDANIQVAIGHTNATLQEVRHAESLGVCLGTHLYNAMSRFNSREPNTVGAILTSNNLYTSIIPDGNHSDFTSIILAHRALGERLFMVTDGILALGTDLKTFIHSNQEVFVDDQKRCINEQGALVGSMVSPIECIQNLVEHCEFTLVEALKSYTYTPAKILGLESQIGSLQEGALANFVLLEEKDLSLKEVFFNGEKIGL